MRKFLIVVLSFLALLVFAKNEISVIQLNNGVKVKTRFAEYEFDLYGNLLNVYIVTERRLHIFEAFGDGLELYDEDGKMLEEVVSFSILGTETAPGSFLSDVALVYEYKDGTVKNITVKNSPEYLLLVEVKTDRKLFLSLPRVWFEDNDRFVRGYFISFAPKNKIVSISKFDKGTLVLNKVQFDGELKVTVHMGPLKRIFLKKLFPEDYSVIVSELRTIRGTTSWYDPLFYPLVWFFWWLYELTKNFGWAIILFTIVVRFILYPLYHAQTKSMIKLRKIQPKIEEVRKKYKDPQKQQEALMKIYQEEGVNPASGCLMLLVQLPIFFLLYAVIRYFQEEFAYGSRFLIWNDLSVGGFSANAIFILITIVASYYNTLITSTDTRSAWQGILMSVIFPFLFVGLPSGLFLYYTTNTVIQLIVTYYIYKRYKIKGITTRELLGLRAKR
ncbi:membrane protein insertase YidC [Pseudothermotoga thermarum]|uniref:Membrane protein insertase YidC n=1 Tax=Pseudothermotoga thermarum DSM 5069 TaxID=688269 RepID=F7YXS8_9THEM|nr:membrane protein insertase YidC [Pseudothermotoga thermarum]AEH50722.1 membrane protein insertase, YidC/Oxa1 family [Pseudothermotoga thermarum DSM 5069]